MSIIVDVLILAGILLFFLNDKGDDNTTLDYDVPSTETRQSLAVESVCSSLENWESVPVGIEERNMVVYAILRDGTPLVGLCISFIFDATPAQALQYVGACRTNQRGYCSVAVPTGLIRLHFGDTLIADLPLASSMNDLVSIPGFSTDNLAYEIAESEEFATAFLVAVPRDDDSIILKNARPNAEGQLQILNEEIPVWAEQLIE